jgi:hypothetical protein
MGLIKKIINKFKPKATIRKKVVVPTQSNTIYSSDDTLNSKMTNLPIFENQLISKTPMISGKSIVNNSDIDNELKVKNIVRPKPRYF